jgi:hypothetical protein
MLGQTYHLLIRKYLPHTERISSNLRNYRSALDRQVGRSSPEIPIELNHRRLAGRVVSERSFHLGADFLVSDIVHLYRNTTIDVHPNRFRTINSGRPLASSASYVG